MNILRTITLSAFLATALSAAGQGKTVLTAETIDYTGQKIYIDCIQTPAYSAEFDYAAGETATYTFAPTRQVAMLINSRTLVIVAPGDSIHAKVRYADPKNVSVTFSGTSSAVAANRLYQKVQALKKSMRYRLQLLSCVTLDEKPAQRIAQSRQLLEKTAAFVETAKDKVTPEAAAYVMAESEGLAYLSFMEYPKMYAELRKLPIAEQEIGDYWALMDSVELRADAASLSCPEYVSMLMRYVAYTNEKAADGTYTMLQKLEDIYREMAEGLEGAQRDAVLFHLLTNFIRGGKEVERAEPLIAEYRQKYNINKDYIAIIDGLME